MIRPLTKLLLVFVLILAAIVGVINAKKLLMPSLYYPYFSIVAPENIRIHALQRGHTQLSQCARSLASQVTALSGSCPNCRVETSECRVNLVSSQLQWLGDAPLATPSARMAYGVLVFEAPQQQIALATCQESQRQSLANGVASRITCFPAESKRPLLSIETDILARENIEQQKSLAGAGASLVGVLVLIVALLASLRRLAVMEPVETTPTPIESVQPVALKLSNICKRVIDILIAVILLIALIPIFFIVAVMIRILEGAPIFYMSRRFTSSDMSVTIFKFRTMVKDAASPKYQLRDRFMRDGYLDIPLECEVYTPIGRFLERSQLVESLQLLNILFNGMSFVGNRPLPKENIELLKKFYGWQERFDSPAGITGISQITGKYKLLPHQRLYLERMYASIYRNPYGNIILCDLCIVVYTVLVLTTGRYLDYEKAVALLIRCGANKELLE